MRRNPSSAAGAAALIAAVLLSPWVTRVLLLYESRTPVAAADARGALSDLAVALLVACLIALAARLARWAAGVLVVLWVALHYANYEYARELGAAIQLSYTQYLTDPTFLRGSALVISRPVLLAALLGVSLVLVWLSTRRLPRGRQVTALFVTSVAALALRAILPQSLEAHTWRQAHVIQENLAQAFPGRIKKPTTSIGSEVQRIFAPDLNGQPIIPLPNPKKNVLLVMLEGIPGAYLPVSAERHGVHQPILLARLDAIARANLVATTFIAHQRGTNRGEYSILCGDFDKLGSGLAKMTEYLLGGTRVCLPHILADAGYHTVYLQGAPMTFMLKDRFMPKVGFAAAHGDLWFKKPYARTDWGVDDRTLFEEGLDFIRELERGDSPWFLAMLTVGTHHPGVLPAGYGSPRSPSRRAVAAEYLDQALEAFLHALEREGIADDTLVLVTCDESFGLRGEVDDVTQELSQNWGLLVGLLPGKHEVVLGDAVTQSDLALSILDYLGVDSSRTEFVGRSIFRRYARPRPIFFSNFVLNKSGAIDPSGRLLYCDEAMEQCNAYEVEDGAIFSPGRRKVDWDPNALPYRHAVLARTLEPIGATKGVVEIDLLADEVVPVRPLRGWHFALSGQDLRIPAGSRVDVELTVRLEGGGGAVALRHKLSPRIFHTPAVTLEAGDRWVIDYSYFNSRTIGRLNCWLYVMALEGRDLNLRFEKALVRISPSDVGVAKNERGVMQEHRIEVERS